MRLTIVLPLLLAVSLAPAAGSAASPSRSSGSDGYLGLEPIVVNVADGRRVRFMQVKMQLMAKDPKVQEAIEIHMPVVRDRLIMLLAHQDAVALRRLEGREALRQEALLAVQSVVSEVTVSYGSPAEVEGVYFTDFVIQ
jgi:flagellar FliL protein